MTEDLRSYITGTLGSVFSNNFKGNSTEPKDWASMGYSYRGEPVSQRDIMRLVSLHRHACRVDCLQPGCVLLYSFLGMALCLRLTPSSTRPQCDMEITVTKDDSANLTRFNLQLQYEKVVKKALDTAEGEEKS